MNRTFGLYKRRAISCVAKLLLTSEEGPSSMELVKGVLISLSPAPKLQSLLYSVQPLAPTHIQSLL